mgnify:CR=1 FL=1
MPIAKGCYTKPANVLPHPATNNGTANRSSSFETAKGRGKRAAAPTAQPVDLSRQYSHFPRKQKTEPSESSVLAALLHPPAIGFEPSEALGRLLADETLLQLDERALLHHAALSMITQFEKSARAASTDQGSDALASEVHGLRLAIRILTLVCVSGHGIGLPEEIAREILERELPAQRGDRAWTLACQHVRVNCAPATRTPGPTAAPRSAG